MNATNTLPTDPSGKKSDLTPVQHPDGSLCVDSTDLLQNHREITIRHGEDLYRLRLTKSGKLILHK